MSPLWFASLLIYLAITLCFRFDLLGGVIFVVVRGLEIYSTSSTKTLHQVTLVLEQKRGETLISGRFCIGPVCTTGLTGYLLFFMVKYLTGLTGITDRSDRSVC